jgi:hypothetical protein
MEWVRGAVPYGDTLARRVLAGIAPIEDVAMPRLSSGPAEVSNPHHSVEPRLIFNRAVPGPGSLNPHRWVRTMDWIGPFQVLVLLGAGVAACVVVLVLFVL